MTQELKDRLREEAATHGFELFGVVEAAKLAEVPFPPNRCLDVPDGFLPGAKSVIVMGMHIWDPMQNAVVTSVLPDGAIPFDDVPGSQYYNMYYEITEARAHRFAEALRDAGYRTAVTHFVHAKAAATLAGLGWIGKQTLCITPQLGPHVRWACVVTDAVLPYDAPFTEDLCGECELCIKSCPTQAIIGGAVPRRGAGQEGRLLEVHRPAGDGRGAQQGVAEVGRPLLAARQPRVPDLSGRLPGGQGRARAPGRGVQREAHGLRKAPHLARA